MTCTEDILFPQKNLGNLSMRKCIPGPLYEGLETRLAAQLAAKHYWHSDRQFISCFTSVLSSSDVSNTFFLFRAMVNSRGQDSRYHSTEQLAMEHLAHVSCCQCCFRLLSRIQSHLHVITCISQATKLGLPSRQTWKWFQFAQSQPANFRFAWMHACIIIHAYFSDWNPMHAVMYGPWIVGSPHFPSRSLVKATVLEPRLLYPLLEQLHYFTP